MSARWLRWPEPATARFGYGADYNPEQWPEEVWADDVRLMKQAGVTIVSVGIFSWALLQPTEDSWNFAWLDRVLDLLHEAGIAVDLATATSSPPPWLTTKHPEILPVTRTGETVWPGGRQQWRPTSPVFREYALRLVTMMAERYADHPALTMWHVSNELGCHNAFDYSDDAAAAFRVWLESRYSSIDALNAAWGTAFWSQHYGAWNEILPPRLAATHPNPTQQLDFSRFSSDALKGYLVAERDILHRLTPDVPVTTNFMIMQGTSALDYADWASEVDIVSNDHYMLSDNPLAFEELSFSANLTGQLTGDPWFLMEHSTSAVNWQSINVPKAPGQLRHDSLTHVAHGADAVCFFQWRQSAAGAEKFHSAMVPHAGPDSAVFRDAAALGAELASLTDVLGSRVKPAKIAVLFDWNARWASGLDSHPSSIVDYHREALDWYAAVLRAGLRADVLPLTRLADIGDYDVVIAPTLYLLDDAAADALTAYAEAGGHLVVTYFSGIVDENDHARLGGYPGAFRDLLGVRSEEFGPMLAGTTTTLDSGATASVWTENVTVADDVEVLARFDGGPFPGVPAITTRAVGGGSVGGSAGGRASYVATSLDAASRTAFVESFGVAPELALPAGVELAIRSSPTSDYLFFINHEGESVTVPGVDGTIVSTGAPTAGSITLAPLDVIVVERDRA